MCFMISFFLQQFIWRSNHALPYAPLLKTMDEFSHLCRTDISWCFENELLFAWVTWIKSADRSRSNLRSSNWIKERQFTIYRNCVYVYIIIMHNSIQQLCYYVAYYGILLTPISNLCSNEESFVIKATYFSIFRSWHLFISTKHKARLSHESWEYH